MLKFCGVALMQAAATEATKGTNSSDNNSAMSFANSSSILNLFLSFSLALPAFLSFGQHCCRVPVFSSCCNSGNSGASFGCPMLCFAVSLLHFMRYLLSQQWLQFPLPPHALLPRPATTMCCLSDKQIRVAAAAAAAPHDV